MAAVISWLLLLAGCASEVLVPDVDKAKPKLVLNQGEFRVVRTVSGRASCPYLLYIDLPDSLLGAVGISSTVPVAFALGNAALHVRAMEDLHSKHDLLGKPQILQTQRDENLARLDGKSPDWQQFVMDHHRWLGCNSYVDREIGRVISAVDETHRDDTIIIFKPATLSRIKKIKDWLPRFKMDI